MIFLLTLCHNLPNAEGEKALPTYIEGHLNKATENEASIQT